MAVVKLDREECEGGMFPPVCVRCGEAATHYHEEKFQWIHPFLLVFFFIFLPLFLLLFSIYRKKMTVIFPYCERHFRAVSQRFLLQTLGTIILIVGTVLGFVFGFEFVPVGMAKEIGGASLLIGFVGGFGLIAVTLFRAIAPIQITAESLTVKNVSPDFVVILDEYRILINED